MTRAHRCARQARPVAREGKKATWAVCTDTKSLKGQDSLASRGCPQRRLAGKKGRRRGRGAREAARSRMGGGLGLGAHDVQIDLVDQTQ